MGSGSGLGVGMGVGVGVRLQGVWFELVGMLERVDVHDGEARDVNGQPHLQWWGTAIVGTTIAKVSAWCRRAVTNLEGRLLIT